MCHARAVCPRGNRTRKRLLRDGAETVQRETILGRQLLCCAIKYILLQHAKTAHLIERFDGGAGLERDDVAVDGHNAVHVSKRDHVLARARDVGGAVACSHNFDLHATGVTRHIAA